MKGKQPFHPDYINPHADPLHSQTVEFDYAAVDRALGEIDSVMKSGDAYDPRQAYAALIRKIFLWGTDVKLRGDVDGLIVIGRRFVALAWVFDPGLFAGSPSATALSKQIGISSSCEFHKLTGAAAREFGITNRAQDHAWNRGQRKGVQNAIT